MVVDSASPTPEGVGHANVEGKPDPELSWIWDKGRGYARLARFASATALQGLALLDKDAYAALASPAVEGAEADTETARAAAAHLYEALRKRSYPYDLPAWHLGRRQRIRDPRAIHQGTATCLDISLLFAAMCKAAGLRPVLVLLEQHDEGMPDHALVLVDLERGIHGIPAGPASEVEWGVWRLTSGTRAVRLSDSAVIIDVTCACRNVDVDFGQAVGRGSAAFADRRYRNVHLVDVLTVQKISAADEQDEGEAQLATGLNRPAIYPNLPPMPEFIDYPSRAVLAKRLLSAKGTVILCGPPGTGKSMLAHHVAATADHGCGWFLDASSRSILTAALAGGEARETGRELESVDAPDARVLSGLALSRLRAATGPWAVVLDNANLPPGQLRGMLPEPDPGRGQLLIVTTTSEDWRSSGEFIDLESLYPDEVRSGLSSDAPLEALAGRPLLVSASQRFRAATARWWWATHPPVGGDPAQEAPACLWAAVDAELGSDVQTRTVAHAISWLPPVRLPMEVIEAVVGDFGGLGASVARLRELGLIDVESGAVTMHRLFRAAVRDDGLASDAAGQVRLIYQVLTSERSGRFTEQAADLETASQMGELLAACADDDLAVGGLHRLGSLFERHGSADSSAGWYARLLDRLGPDIPPEHRLHAADALRGQARTAMRSQSSPEDRRRVVDEAIGWMIEAARLCYGDTRPARLIASQVEAMHGLLVRQKAGAEENQDRRLELLHEAEELLRHSASERRELVDNPDSSPEIDRSRYNLAGLELRLAQVDPGKEAGHLDEAERHYSEILDIRRARYRTEELEEVVCCINGQALVAYYRAALLSLAPLVKLELLRVGADKAAQATLIRQRLAGQSDDGNTAKSVALSAKIALARLRVTEVAGIKAERDLKVIGEYQDERARLSIVTSADDRTGD